MRIELSKGQVFLLKKVFASEFSFTKKHGGPGSIAWKIKFQADELRAESNTPFREGEVH